MNLPDKNDFIRSALILTVVGTVFLFASTLRATSNISQGNQDILNHLKQQQDVNSQNVIDLKDDNSQQTIILCTLILGQNVPVTGEDAAKIEQICKEKVDKNKADAQAAQDSQPLVVRTGQATPDGEPAPGTLSNPTPPTTSPETPETPPNPPPKDEGILPDSIPLVGRLL